MNKDVLDKGLTALAFGAAGYLTGVSLDNETMASFFKYATMPEYAATAKFIGAVVCAASVAAMAKNTICELVESFYKKDDKKKPNPPVPPGSY